MDINFIERKQEKERGCSVSGVLKEASTRIANTKDIIVLTIDKDNMVEINYSVDEEISLIGYLELTKQAIINNL